MKPDVEWSVGVRSGPGAVLPADLLAAVVATVVADAVVLVGGPRPLQLGAAAVLLFVLPGYAIVAALYPEARPDRTDVQDDAHGLRDDTHGHAGIGLAERAALSFAASVAAVAVLGLAAWYVGASLTGPASTGTGITRTVTLALVTLVVVVACGVAAVRRLRRPQSDRFSVPAAEWIDAGRDAVIGGETRSERVLSVALAASIVLAGGALGYAVSSPVDGEQYTLASVLAERDDGTLVADGYSSDLTAGEPAEFALELDNHEGAATTYTTVVQVERIDATGGGGATVTEASELDRLSATVPAGETRTIPHEVAPELTGEDLRLSYYVYRDDAPADPSPSSAYHHVYVSISVEGG